MSIPKKIKNHLSQHMPAAAIPLFWNILSEIKVQMIISRARQTKFGDFRPPSRTKPARISVNGDLPPEAFLMTAIHELAHAKVYFEYKDKGLRNIAPHGKEWKRHFKLLMEPFLHPDIFNEPSLSLVKRHMQNPSASSMRDREMFEALHGKNNHDIQNQEATHLSNLKNGEVFIFRNRQFKRMELLRVYVKCQALDNKRLYRIHGSVEVERV